MPTEPETGNRIGNLHTDWPEGGDPISQGDDHIRSIKRSLQGTFPTIGEDPIRLTAEQINSLYYQEDRVGLIEMWSADLGDIPAGYAVCDGLETNGHTTANFIDKFAKAAITDTFILSGNDTVILSDGSHALTLAQIPAHKHDGIAYHPNSEDADQGGSRALDDAALTNSSISTEGGGLGHIHAMVEFDIKPLFYTLIYIEWVGYATIIDATPLPNNIGNMDITSPAGDDFLSLGDDEMRLLKSELQGSFSYFGELDQVIATAAEWEEAYERNGDIGTIAMWNGVESLIPDGYSLCDGRTSNGYLTPTLTGYFIKSTAVAGTIGGRSSSPAITEGHALTYLEVPDHEHSLTNHSTDAGANTSDPAGSNDDAVKYESPEGRQNSGLKGGVDNGDGTWSVEEHTHTHTDIQLIPLNQEVHYVAWVGRTL
jgi:hypothetical protein